jgi:predicted small metal-binding protein
MGSVSLRPRATEEAGVRVIDCNECGETIQAANDEELVEALNKHMEAKHSDAEWDDEQASELVESGAYDATDA